MSDALVDRDGFVLFTSRFELSPLTVGDRYAVHKMWTSPGVRRYLWDNEEIPMQQTDEILRRNEMTFVRKQFGLWGARVQGSGELIGFGGFWHFEEDNRHEIMFGVTESFWNWGMGSEIAAGVLEYGRAVLGFDPVYATSDPENHPAVRILAKLGFSEESREEIEGTEIASYVLKS